MIEVSKTEEKKIETEEYFAIFTKWFWVILITSILATGVFYYLMRNVPSTYKSSALIMVNQRSTGTIMDFSALTMSQQLTKTYAELANKRPVTEGVINDLGLNMTPEILSKSISTELIPDTQLFKIGATNQDAQLAANITNSLANSLKTEVGKIQKQANLSSQSTLEIVEEATLSNNPIAPNKKQKTVFIFFLTFLLATGLVYLLELTDRSIRDIKDITRYLDLPYLGLVGRIKRVGNEQLKSEIAESLKEIRTNISFSNTESSFKNLLVTSSLNQEGKSFIATNLAIAMAKTGKKVLLIDADMRRPTIHRYFNLKRNLGLSNILCNYSENNSKNNFQETDTPGLKVLSAGIVPPNPSELLTSERMDNFLEKTNKDFDLVILDSPPAGMVTDAAILASKVDGIVLVVEAGKTSRDIINETKESLIKVGGKIIGVVLNKYRKNSGSYYKYKGYYKYKYHSK